jgi:hypothetical protein
MNRWILIPVVVAAIGCAARAMAQEAPTDISQWDLICYCNATVATPHFAVRADNNGRILYLAREGIALDALRQDGVTFADSQIYLLRAFHLLERKGDIWTTSMPLLGSEKMKRMRALLRVEAKRVVDSTRADARAIAEAVAAQGFPDNAYSVLFSYVLDGRTWEVLDAAKAMPDLDMTADHPFWGGLFWAVYPKRTGAPGTNSTSKGKVGICFTWTDRTLTGLSKMQASPGLDSFLESVAQGTPRTTPLAYADGGEWRLASADGKMLVPVIRERAGDPIYEAAGRIADAFATRIQDKDLVAKLGEIAGTTRNCDTVLIAMHEFIWEALDAYEAEGVVHAPETDSSSAPASESALRKLVLIVDQP